MLNRGLTAEEFVGESASESEKVQGTGAAINVVGQDSQKVAEVQTYSVSVEELKIRRRTSYTANAAALIGDELTIKIPDFHFSIWSEILRLANTVSHLVIGHVQKAWTVPREHSKTTLVKLAIPVIFRQTELSFLLYASNTQSMAVSAVKDVVEWLLSDSEARIWGRAYVLKKNETEGLWILKIPLEDGTLKRVILKAVGVLQQIRGVLIYNKRPDLLIFDDIEGLGTADSGKQQTKLNEWFFGDALKCSAKRSFRLMVGNLIRDTTLLAKLCKLPSWNPTRFGALVLGPTGQLRPLWPGRHTTESLLTDYREHRANGVGHVWESEMMNISRDLSLADSIPESAMKPAMHPESIESGFITLDPAFGQTRQHDDSAITVHVKYREYAIPMVVDAIKGQFTEEQLFDLLIDLMIRWELNTVVIEAIAGQRLFIPLFKAYCVIRSIPEGLLNFYPLTGQNTPNAKASRISSFRDNLRDGGYALSDLLFDLRTEIEEWSPESAEHDDLPDSASLGAIAWASEGLTLRTSAVRVVNLGQRIHFQKPKTSAPPVPRHLVTL